MWDFHYGQHTISMATHIALLDAGADFTAHRLDLTAGQHQGGAYAKLNPKLRVPTLVTPDGVLTETPALLVYIAQKFPDAGLIPSDAFGFAKVQEFCSYLASTLHVAHAHRMRGHRWVDPTNSAAIAAMQAKVAENMTAAFSYVEETAAFGPYVMGERYSIADPYLFTVSRWLGSDGVAPGAVPKVEAHRAMMFDRASVKLAIATQEGD